jgi:hypothetical protein
MKTTEQLVAELRLFHHTEAADRMEALQTLLELTEFELGLDRG